MNKAKAYRRLKKKQKQSIHDWTTLCAVNDSVIRLPLKDIKQATNITEQRQQQQQQRSNSSADLGMFGVRNFDTLKSITETEDLESGIKSDSSKRHTSLPNISTRQWLPQNTERQTISTPSAVLSKCNSVRRTGTTANEGYTLLQAKLDALILPNPVKRKASRSFSGSSSGFQGRKITLTKKDVPAMKSGIPKLDSPNNSTIQFPIASKMRQLLTVEPADQKVPNQELPSTGLTTPFRLQSRGRSKEVTKAARFYFPSYANQNMNNSVNTSASIDSKFKLAPTTSKLTRPAGPPAKQVSFLDDNHNIHIIKQKTQSANQQSLAAPPSEIMTLPNGLMLTTKNLEMYNTLTMTSELSAPSEDDSRVICWIKDRQQWTTERCDGIPEIEENQSSAPPADDSRSMASSSVHAVN